MKYIRTQDLGIVIFGSHITHKEMLEKLITKDDAVVSAGFVSVSSDSVRLFGQSVSLKLSSLKEDTQIFEQQSQI